MPITKARNLKRTPKYVQPKQILPRYSPPPPTRRLAPNRIQHDLSQLRLYFIKIRRIGTEAKKPTDEARPRPSKMKPDVIIHQREYSSFLLKQIEWQYFLHGGKLAVFSTALPRTEVYYFLSFLIIMSSFPQPKMRLARCWVAMNCHCYFCPSKCQSLRIILKHTSTQDIAITLQVMHPPNLFTESLLL